MCFNLEIAGCWTAKHVSLISKQKVKKENPKDRLT